MFASCFEMDFKAVMTKTRQMSEFGIEISLAMAARQVIKEELKLFKESWKSQMISSIIAMVEMELMIVIMDFDEVEMKRTDQKEQLIIFAMRRDRYKMMGFDYGFILKMWMDLIFGLKKNSQMCENEYQVDVSSDAN